MALYGKLVSIILEELKNKTVTTMIKKKKTKLVFGEINFEAEFRIEWNR